MLTEEIIDQIADKLEEGSKDALSFIKEILEKEAYSEGEQAGFDGDQSFPHSYKEGSFRDKAWQEGYQVGQKMKEKHAEYLIILDAVFVEGEQAFIDGKNVRENPHTNQEYKDTWTLGFWNKGDYKCDFSNFLSQLK